MSINYMPAHHLAAWLALVIFACPAQSNGASKEPQVQRAPAFLTRVKAKFEVGGDLRLNTDGQPSTLPMSVVAQFDFFERRIDDGSLPSERRSIRYYSDAQAAIKVEKQASVAKLAAEHRLVRAAVSENRTTLGAARGHLTREERDLIDIPFNTLLLSQLLPAATAERGSSSKPSDATVAMLLGLDAVSRSDVETVLTAIKDGVGEVSIQGPLNGAVGGVSTEIELKGKLHFDVVHRQPFALVLLIKEKRSVGHVMPGLDVVAKLDLQVAPASEVAELSDRALEGLELATDGAAPPLAYESTEGGFSFLYEPRWQIMGAKTDSAVMRLVDRGELIAQCNVSVLPKLNVEQPLTLEMFQKEVQQSLGKHFGSFEGAAERETPSGLRLLHVVAIGTVSELPITWHYYLLINRSGQRAAISFTMENALADRFGEADRLVLDGFRFTPQKPASAARPVRTTR
ncbi:MAG: hypothetical protein WD894_03050 [Pirellulales bacterium]